MGCGIADSAGRQKWTIVQKIRHLKPEMVEKSIPIGSLLAFTGIVQHGHAAGLTQACG
jgi:hypothetical protein